MWEKGSTADLNLAVSVENGDAQKWEVDGYVGFTKDFGTNIGTFVGVGAGVELQMEAKVLEGTIKAGTGGEWSNSRAQVVSNGNGVTLTAQVSYEVGGGDPDEGLTGVAGDVIVTPSVAIRTLLVLPIIFNNNKVSPLPI